MINRLKYKNIILIFLLIPFLCPRGFLEYFSFYKLFFSAWLYLSVGIIYIVAIAKLLTLKKIKINSFVGSMILYFSIIIIITFLVRQSFSGALQKLFATPALCIFSVYYLKKNPLQIIKYTNNILIIIFVLNSTIFSPLFWPTYFRPISNHLLFIGHVQTAVQIGMLAILTAYIEYEVYNGNKKKYVLLMILSYINMLMSFTSAAYISIILLLLFKILGNFKIYGSIALEGRVYLSLYLLLNFIFFLIICAGKSSLEIAGFSLNGRGFIWAKAIESFFKSPIYGYGANGVLIKVFWSYWVGDGQGMNYMHNQILQILNDGGIILFAAFIYMLYIAMSTIDKLKGKKIRYQISTFIAIILIVMTFESVMEYFYFSYILCIVAYLPKLVQNRGASRDEY